MTHLKLEEVVKIAKTGNGKALSELINRYKIPLFRYCYFLCKEQNLADEISQDAFVKAISKLDQLRENKFFKTWLFKIARSSYFSYLSSPRNRADEYDEKIHHEDKTFHGIFERKELVVKILERFSDEEKNILLLMDMQGFTAKETSETLNINESTIRTKILKLRKDFVEEYLKYDPEFIQKNGVDTSGSGDAA